MMKWSSYPGVVTSMISGTRVSLAGLLLVKPRVLRSVPDIILSIPSAVMFLDSAATIAGAFDDSLSLLLCTVQIQYSCALRE
jgi:hypothetical protein